jgi:hypothetical protein
MMHRQLRGVSGRTWVIDETRQAGPGGRSTPFFAWELGNEANRLWAQRAIGGDDWADDQEHLRRAFSVAQRSEIASCPFIHAPIDLIESFDVYLISSIAKETLAHALRLRTLDVTELAALERALRGGLALLHDLDLVHSDVREDNVFLVEGDWKLGDLGAVVRANDPIVSIQREPCYRPAGAQLGASAAVDNDLFALEVVLRHVRARMGTNGH